MKLLRGAAIALLMSSLATTVARADDATPVASPSDSSPPPPTPVQVVDTPVTIQQPTAVPNPSPVAVVQEHNTPVVSINQPGVAESTAVPTVAAPSAQEGTAGPAPSSIATFRSTQSGTSQLGTTSSLTSTSPLSAVPSVTSPDLSSSTNTYDLTQLSTAASAPAQLQCHGAIHPVAAPFMVSPFSGWTEVASFLDHDQPDYAVDGKIVITNGLSATSSDGQASDLFPAYWSPRLRQFVNYDGHNGYDFGISYQPVLAAGAGTVQFAGWNSSDPYSGYGQMILINHHNGYVTLYGHLSKLEVQKGDHVLAGQEIGISGTTGNSSGPHLHFSVFHDCNVTDPYGWTGQGQDPLAGFNGEQSAYLWLPGRDPLLLNPPPQWPTFPLDLRLPGAAASRRLVIGRPPPAERLLLLALPEPVAGRHFSPGEALASTEAQVTREAQSLAPSLEALRRQGLIDQYQVIPAAAGIWVRGSASAQQLESLSGVASLTGVTPRDLVGAELGLAHSILIQIGRQEAPALWPVGFRSDLNAWRPVLSVLTGQALVAGTTLPGHHVVLELHRSGVVPGAAEAVADPQTGGFVAMLHDAKGAPVGIEPGDTVEVQSAGRAAFVRVLKLSVKARLHGTQVDAPSTSAVTISVGGAHEVSNVRIAAHIRNMRVDFPSHSPLLAGTQVVASILDPAGDEQAAQGIVPGAVLTVGSSLVSGWAVGHNPMIRVLREGRVLASQPIQAATDGAFEVDLESGGRTVRVSPGETVTFGSSARHRTLLVPPLSATYDAEGSLLRAHGSPGAVIHVELDRIGGITWSQSLHLDSYGASWTRAPGGPLRLGDAALLQDVLPSGDVVTAITEARGITAEEGTPVVTGISRPGSLVNVGLLDAAGRRLATSIVTADPRTGAYNAVLTDATGATVLLEPRQRLRVDDGAADTTVRLPVLALKLSKRTNQLWVNGAAGGGVATLALESRTHVTRTRRLKIEQHGRQAVALRHAEIAALARASVSIPLGPGVTVSRTLAIRFGGEGGVACSSATRSTLARCSASHHRAR